jgi:exodeoxyribonuclease VII small subunit
MTKKKQEIPFEAALAELNDIVATLERGDSNLDESLQKFERGVELTRVCQQLLQTAQAKVQILMQKEGTDELQPYEDDTA